jgi:hypothetical protein
VNVHPESTIEAAEAEQQAPPREHHYCDCAIPIPVERAERRGAAYRVCARCELPIPVRWSRW